MSTPPLNQQALQQQVACLQQATAAAPVQARAEQDRAVAADRLATITSELKYRDHVRVAAWRRHRVPGYQARGQGRKGHAAAIDERASICS